MSVPASLPCPRCQRPMLRQWDEWQCLTHGPQYGRREEDMAEVAGVPGRQRNRRPSHGGRSL